MAPPVVLFAGKASQRDAYRTHLTRAAVDTGIDITLHMAPEDVAPAMVDYLVFAANGPVRDFTPFTNLKGILNLWAGVENVLKLDPPAHVPLVRMVEDGLTLGMIDYCVGHAMRHHLDADRYIGAQPIPEWEVDFPPLARDRCVGVLGLGALGSEVATRLSLNGFRTIGWSRTPKTIADVDCRHGEDGLDRTVAEAEILILLLPLTASTRHMMNARRIGLMRRGACLINAGRGPLIDHEALIAALDADHLRHATMDVFDVEPLPADDPYWSHPRVTVTPHIASVTRPETASDALIRQIARHSACEPFLHVVDRALGY